MINSINCHNSEISHFVDQPLLREIPSYIKRDTNDFIRKINNEGIASGKKRYDLFPKKTIPTKTVATFLALIQTLNNFILNSKSQLQIKDCAMGTTCAPSYANIFMLQFEEKHVYSLIENKSLIYLCYIDNILKVWVKSESELRHFMNKMNQKHRPIKFDFKFSKESIEFLETLMYIDSSISPCTKTNLLPKLLTSEIGTYVLILKKYPIQSSTQN